MTGVRNLYIYTMHMEDCYLLAYCVQKKMIRVLF